MMEIFGVVYLVGYIVCWRMLTGYYAWRIHTTAKTKSGITPEPEDWLLAAIGGLILSSVWPAMLIIKYAPMRFKTESEQEAERMSAQIKYERLKLENDRRLKELDP